MRARPSDLRLFELIRVLCFRNTAPLSATNFANDFSINIHLVTMFRGMLNRTKKCSRLLPFPEIISSSMDDYSFIHCVNIFDIPTIQWPLSIRVNSDYSVTQDRRMIRANVIFVIYLIRNE